VRGCHLLSPPLLLVRRVGQQRDVARAFDRLGQHALVRRARARNATRQNLAAFGHVACEQLHVFEVYVINFVLTEATNLAPTEAPPATATALRPAFAVAALRPPLVQIEPTLITISRHNFSQLSSVPTPP